MKVLMKKNLGSRDAAALGVDFRECLEGAEVSVSDAAAEMLVKLGMASVVEDVVEKPHPIKAVPAEPVKAKPESASVKGK